MGLEAAVPSMDTQPEAGVVIEGVAIIMDDQAEDITVVDGMVIVVVDGMVIVVVDGMVIAVVDGMVIAVVDGMVIAVVDEDIEGEVIGVITAPSENNVPLKIRI